MNYFTALLFLAALIVMWVCTGDDEHELSGRDTNPFTGIYDDESIHRHLRRTRGRSVRLVSTVRDGEVDAVLDALIDAKPSLVIGVVAHVRDHGLVGTYRISDCMTIHFHPVENEPESCPGSDCKFPLDCSALIRCEVVDCGQLVRTYFDGVQWRKSRHNRPTTKAAV